MFMRSLLIATLLIGLAGGVSAQENVTAEDFTTDKPDVGFRMNPVDGLFNGQNFTTYEADESSGFTDNGDYITVDASTNGYVSVFEFPNGNDNDEWMRGKVEITHEFSNVDDFRYNLVQVTDPDDALENIRQTHNLETISGSTNGQETITLKWDEEDLIQDSGFDVTNTKNPEHIGIQIWPTTGGQSVDIHRMDFIKSQETYTETFYNGTLSTGWNTPETTQVNGETIQSLENNIVGSEGDYRWEVTTDSIYVAEYDIPSLTPSELQYYKINASVPKGGTLYYGLGSYEGRNENVPYELSEGIQIINGNNSDSEVNPFFAQTIYDDNLDEGLNSDIRPYHFQIGGLVSGNRTFSSSRYNNTGQMPWSGNFESNSRPWYWRSDSSLYSTDLPFPLNKFDSDEEYNKVIIVMDSVSEGSHTFEISEMTYGPTATDLDPGGTVDIGEGEDVDPIDDRNEIVDGGIIDQGITAIANYTGLGLTATRFLLGILISLGVGLAVGWSEEYGSTTLGAMAFGFTFISLMLVGLVPMVYGLIFTLVAGGTGWLSWKNQTDKVVVNG